MDTKIIMTKLGIFNMNEQIHKENEMLNNYRQQGYKITHSNLAIDNNNYWIYYLLEKD